MGKSTAQRASGVPLYHTTYLVLRRKILEGAFPPSVSMPPEMELAKQFGVSRITVRRALDELRMEGLITRSAGRGTYALYDAAERPGIEERLSSDLIENLVALGLKAKAQVLEFTYVTAPAFIARDLQIEPDSTVQRAVRLRSFRGRPFAHLTTFVPEDLGRTYTKAELTTNLLLSLFERAGVSACSAEQSISATVADPGVAEVLDIALGEPLLSITRLVRDQNDRPVEHLQALYRPDIYSYRMSMTRVRVPDAAIWAPKQQVVSVQDFKMKAGNKNK
jgi:GntR family transcriptional regulator